MLKNQFQFCPKCGGNLKPTIFEEVIQSYTCKNCGFIFYQNSKPCVSAIISKNNKILLTKRKVEPYFGMWDLPGGFVENGEDPEEAIKRELKEELNAEVRIKNIFGIMTETHSGIYVLTINYECELLNDNLVPKDDIEEFRWFDLKEIPEKLAFQSPKKFLNDYRELLNK